MRCGRCGAQNLEDDATCRVCQADLSVRGASQSPGEEAAPRAEPARHAESPASKAMALGACGSIAGFMLGNFQPMWGGVLVQNVAKPWSPMRMQAGYEHGLAGFIVVTVIALLAFLANREAARATAGEPRGGQGR